MWFFWAAWCILSTAQLFYQYSIIKHQQSVVYSGLAWLYYCPSSLITSAEVEKENIQLEKLKIASSQWALNYNIKWYMHGNNNK